MVRDGYFYGGTLLLVAAAIYYLTGSWIWPILPILLAAFFLWFFRDPRRVIPSGPGLIVSPGDGLVTSTDVIETPAGPKLRISIFLNVFNVHVNRSPIAGILREVHYQHGKYLNAMNPDSADHNEQNIVVVEGEESGISYEVTFKQIAGLLARRIVFTKHAGERVARGERVGLIKFGSRVDVVLPPEATLRVAKGDHVQGGATVLAQIQTLPELAGAIASSASETTMMTAGH
ncbi:MAG TPA: phosphatidylserine decarboxylase [Acidisarcina sp.]